MQNRKLREGLIYDGLILFVWWICQDIGKRDVPIEPRVFDEKNSKDKAPSKSLDVTGKRTK